MEVVVRDVRRWPGVAACDQLEGTKEKRLSLGNRRVRAVSFYITGVDGNRNNTLNQGVYANSQQGGAKCGAVGAPNGAIDADLQLIIDAWPTLPAGVKRDVLGLVEAAAEATE